ncbi:TetR/AcrR family transcriptional regulator [Paenibacillus albicereus]|uniref:TetR/AcrR family transcriptional regulator n=1 Tax=Paenibacillus albicereus TaxID=2726185 RepID=A0A6H2GU71_9BACL|nr:TetR/AcrR family transcriptional regulator [Paenibacillus albicereus]
MFIQKGYGAATLKDIIEETGMSRGWIYLYYQTKEEIFEDLLEYQDREYERYLSELVAAKPSIWDVVETLYSEQLEQLQRSPDGGLMPAFYEYSLVGWRDSARRDLLSRRYEQGIARFAALIRLGIDRGEFSPRLDVDNFARLAASYQEGILTHSITIGIRQANAPMQIEALLSYFKTLLRPGFGGDPAQREDGP